jgi:serpin B
MARVLGIEGLSLDEVNAANATLLAGLQRDDPKVQIHSAQSLWLDHGFSLQPTFAQRVQQFYQGEVRTLDLTSPAAVPTINRWVSDETNGKIDQVIDEERISKEILFLLNAIYFKAAWEQPFDRRMTQDGPFTLLDGQTVTVPMMRQPEGAYPYLRGDGFQAAGVPYCDGQSTLYVFVPDSPAGLERFLSVLDDAHWQQWRQQFARTRIYLKLPRFSMKDAWDLKPPLVALGMGSAFDPDRARLEGLVRDPLGEPGSVYVTQARHAAFVEVNEEGTEAAGATAIGALASLPPVVAADRPFFFAIVDDASGATLFVGTLVAPG